jgi:hypothetical protein
MHNIEESKLMYNDNIYFIRLKLIIAMLILKEMFALTNLERMCSFGPVRRLFIRNQPRYAGSRRSGSSGVLSTRSGD